MPGLEPPHTLETYLDHAAGAPLLEEARLAFLRALDALPGNPGSAHAAGRRLRAVLESAREQVAGLAGVSPREVVFTSGSTESTALALEGALCALGPGTPVLHTAACHPSTQALLTAWGAGGRRVHRLGVDRTAHVQSCLDDLSGGVPGPLVATLPLVEPVTGALQDVAGLAASLPPGSVLHVDAAQAAGRVDLAELAAPAGLVSLSAHKIGGLAGIAALIARDGTPFAPPRGLAAQERGRRPGTESAALAAAFGAAAVAARARVADFAAHADRVLAPLHALLDDECAAARAERLTSPPCAPGFLSFRFAGCRGDTILAAVDRMGFRVSTGTACASGARLPAAVVIATGRTERDAAEVVRVSVGPSTTLADVRAFATVLRELVSRMRAPHAGQEKSSP